MTLKNKDLTRYDVRYNPQTYSPTEGSQQVPDSLKQAIQSVFDGTEFYFHSLRRHTIAVGMPEEKVLQLKALEGIVRVALAVPYDLEDRTE